MYLTILNNNIKKGILNLHMPDGSTHRFGTRGMEAHWYVRKEAAMKRVAADPAFELGQTYMEQLWDTGGHDLRDLLLVLRGNFQNIDNGRWYDPLIQLYRRFNRIARSYADIAHHYDTDEAVFRRFLDAEMFYSCAYFKSWNDSLEQAQLNKADHIGDKLLLSPGQTVLDIGCGWGSLAFRLAQRHGAAVTGITLSKEQLRVAREEARRRGLQDLVRFELADYREHQGSYDRIVSVGMLEHVGVENFDTYFRRVREMLKEDGVALIHSIGNIRRPKGTNPWIGKYIFPGGRIPSLSEMAAGVEGSRLMSTDVEVLRLHYARTLHHWLDRFQQHREEIRADKGEEFCRMWEFYLAACESAFACSDLVVFQFQLAHRHGVVPITRDYLHLGENVPSMELGQTVLQERESLAEG